MRPRIIGRLLLALQLALHLHPASACTPPTVDAKAGTGGLATAVTLTTTKANEIILYYVALGSNGGNAIPPAMTGLADTAGLTWAKRFRQTYVSGCADGCWPGNRNAAAAEMWWAYSPGVLTGDVITPAFSGAVTGFHGAAALGVAGVTNFVSPWDVTVALPELLSGDFPPPATAVSTSQQADLLVIGCANLVGGTQCGNPLPPFPAWGVQFVFGGDTLGGALAAFLFWVPTLPLQTARPYYAGGTEAVNWITSANALVGDPAGCQSTTPQVEINE